MCFGKVKRKLLRRVSPCFGLVMALWSEHCGLSIVLSLATLSWWSLSFLTHRPIIFFEIGIENCKFPPLFFVLCKNGVLIYARASVCSVANCITPFGWLFHLNIMSSLAYFAGTNDTNVVTHKQTFSHQAFYLFYKKESPLLQLELSISLCTCIVTRFHGHVPWQRVSKINRTRCQSSFEFLSENRKPLHECTMTSHNQKSSRKCVIDHSQKLCIAVLFSGFSAMRLVKCTNPFEQGCHLGKRSPGTLCRSVWWERTPLEKRTEIRWNSEVYPNSCSHQHLLYRFFGEDFLTRQNVPANLVFVRSKKII